jgi:hypothetical protein
MRGCGQSQRKGIFSVLCVSTDLETLNPGLVEKFLAVHRDLSVWIRGNPEKTRDNFGFQFSQETGKALGGAFLSGAWKDVGIPDDPSVRDFMDFMKEAQAARGSGSVLPKRDAVFSPLGSRSWKR